MKTMLKPAREKSVPSIKYLCNRCLETFEVLSSHHLEDILCPYCAGRELSKVEACSLEIGPPQWEYTCRRCGIRFRIKSPKGPDEAKAVRCLQCGSAEVKWMVGATWGCPSGG
jgi:DNA-directed RNA polymerase subunit RPC12/RpoP